MVREINPPNTQNSSPEHRFAPLVWAIPLLTSLMVGSTIWLRYQNARLGSGTIDIVASEVILSIAYPVVGALILQRWPRHSIGVIFCGMGFAAALAIFGTQYNLYEVHTALKPLASTLGWIGSFVFYIYTASFALLILLFPNGRSLSPRWRWVSGAILLSIVYFFLAVSIIFPPSGITTQSFLSGEVSTKQTELMETYLIPLIFIFQPVSYLLATSALVLRYRRANLIERQQLKWLVFGVSSGIGMLILYILLKYFTPLKVLSDFFGGVGLEVLVIAIPASVAVAIMRHRLWDIDLIIRRTLVYGALTALLALFYFGIVVVLQNLVGQMTGENQNEIVTVLSTLAIAALFTPLRRRIQDFIDRRFYRKHYDAERTIQSFAASLRNEVDLDQLSQHLISVVQETMQPESVSMWIREPGERTPGIDYGALCDT